MVKYWCPVHTLVNWCLCFHHHNHCWLLYFEVFLWFLLTDECDHLFRWLLTLGVLCLVIVLSPYIIIVFLPAQWRLFMFTIIDCYILKCFYYSSSWMTATTSWHRWFYWKYFAERLYYRYIDIMITDFIWSTLLRNITLLLILFITNYKKKTNIWKVINSHLLFVLIVNVHFWSYYVPSHAYARESPFNHFDSTFSRIPAWQ